MTAEDILVEPSEAGERLDIFIAQKTGITRSQIQRLIVSGAVVVHGLPVSQSYRVRQNDRISITITREDARGLVPEPIPVDILYQDSHLVVVDKPAGMVVYPAAGHGSGTLMNALACHCRNLAASGGPLRPGVVHRLDKDTSGVMVVALEDRTYYDLVEQFKKRTIFRRYIALVSGNLREESGEIASKIGRSESDRKKMSVRGRRGKEAITYWKVLEHFMIATMVEIRLGTGRTHQIRVHFSSVGHPVLGDRTYGKKIEIEIENEKKKITFPRQMLHAAHLGFRHPESGEYLEFSSPLPEDMQLKIRELRN